MSPRFELQLDRERYAPGDTIKATILVLEGGRSRSLEAALDYVEETEDYLDVGTSISAGVLHTGELQTGTSFQVEWPLPADAFPNYRSEHAELYWRLDVKSNESGRDTHERRRIEVEPPERETEPSE